MPYIFGGPPRTDSIGNMAGKALKDALQGWHKIGKVDLSLLNFLLRTSPDSRADLISYVFFEPEFIEQAIGLGQNDGRVAWTGGWKYWG
jgi:NTE family protein